MPMIASPATTHFARLPLALGLALAAGCLTQANAQGVAQATAHSAEKPLVVRIAHGGAGAVPIAACGKEE